MTGVNIDRKIRTDKLFLRSIVVAVAAVSMLAILTTGSTATTVQAAGPSGCPDPGYCTCNTASGVMTDHKMEPPFNRINNGCTEEGTF